MLSYILTFLLLGNAQAQEEETPTSTATSPATPAASPAATPAKKPALSTSLYEDEPTAEAKTSALEKLTAKVRVVREDYEGVEVFFEGEKNRGAYLLHRSVDHYATHLKTLEDSKKPQGPMVNVEFDKNKRIKKVEKLQVNKPDPNKTWDFTVPAGQ